MNALYRPVKITSAEQAEALPEGTPVLEVLTEPGEEERVIGADFIDDSFDEDLTPGMNWHYVALVPIEARESRDEGVGWIVPTAFGPKLMGAYLGRPDDTPAKRYTQTTWRTPWTPTEEA